MLSNSKQYRHHILFFLEHIITKGRSHLISFQWICLFLN